MSGPLPRRVRFKTGESGLSLALRLAHRSEMRWVEFASATGLPKSGLRMSNSIERLAEMSGVPVQALRPMTPTWNGWGNPIEVAGLRLDPSRFLRLNLRVCPSCMRADVQRRANGERLEDAAYLRLDWSFAFVFGCLEHGRRLVSRCTSCGERPKWNVGSIDRCHCGHDLKLDEAEELSDLQRSLLRAIIERLHGGSRFTGPLQMLDGVDLLDAMNLIRFLGELSVGAREASPAAAFEIDDLAEVMIAGVETLQDLPGSFDLLLDRIVHRRRTAGPKPVTLIDHYGLPLIRWMRSGHSFNRTLRPIVDGHMSRLGLSAPKKNGGGSRWDRPGEAAHARLGLEDMRRLRAATDWRGSDMPWARDVVSSQKGSGTLLTLTGAAAMFGVANYMFERIVAAGLVRIAWMPGSAEHDTYYRSEIDDLLVHIRGSAPVVDTGRTDLIALGEAGRRGRHGLLPLIEGLLSGRLACAGVLERVAGIRGCLLRLDDVELKSIRLPPGCTPGWRICERLGIDAPKLARLRREGHLASDMSGGIYVSTERDVAEFEASFVSTAKLVSATRLDIQTVRRRLKLAKITGLVAGARNNFYPRCEAESALGVGLPGTP